MGLYLLATVVVFAVLAAIAAASFWFDRDADDNEGGQN